MLTRRICGEYEISALLVTHSIEEAVIMADRIIVMDKNPGSIKAVLENNVKDSNSKHRTEFAAEMLCLLSEQKG